MTANSDRRAAEQAVIDAAIAVTQLGSSELFMASELERLKDAVTAYLALPVETPGKTYSSAKALETSHEAADWFASRAEGLATKVFVAIYRAWLGGGTGLTTWQLQIQLGGEHQSVSPRVTELLDLGLIRPSGMKRTKEDSIGRKLGRPANVWTPTAIAIDALKHRRLPWGW